MKLLRFSAVLWLLSLGCSEKKPAAPSSVPAINSAFFAVVESELTPATLVHSASKYLGLFADAEAPSYIAFATRNGPRSFRNGQKLTAAELEECWLLTWWTNATPWVVYLQRKPLALTLDAAGLHLSFGQGAGDVVLLPLHGTAKDVDTKKWPEFLLREPLLRIRYWAGVLREYPIDCESSFSVSNHTVHVRQKFRFHSIRDDWNTMPLKLAPMSPRLAAAADEKLKRILRDLEMPTLSGPYTGIEGVAEWEAVFPLTAVGDTNEIIPRARADAMAVGANGWPCISSPANRSIGCIKFRREQPSTQPQVTRLNPNTRLLAYQP